MALSLGLGLGLSFARSGGGGDPLLQLFANGESGFLFYPALADQLFQDSAGTAPVTADNDPVARWTDQSPNGDDAIQSVNTSYRPVWKPNSGNPYILPDGIDDRLITSFIPNGSGLTMAIAGRASKSVGNKYWLGGGASTGNKRAWIGISPTGFPFIGWGTAATGDTDIDGQDVVILVTGDTGNAPTVYVDNVAKSFSFSGAPDGTGGGLALCAYNNAGTPSGYNDGRLYGAMALDRLVTSTERTMIFNQFRSKFP